MAFIDSEPRALLQLKGVGPTVIERLEAIGIHSLRELGRYRVEDITQQVAQMLGTTCWRNSPQARRAIESAIGLARQADGSD